MITKLLDLFGLVWKPDFDASLKQEAGSTGIPLKRKKSVVRVQEKSESMLEALELYK